MFVPHAHAQDVARRGHTTRKRIELSAVRERNLHAQDVAHGDTPQ